MDAEFGAQVLGVCAQRNLGAVVFFGQVTQTSPLKSVHPLAHELRAVDVREVSARSFDTCLQMWRIATVFQHLFVVIAFNNHGVQ